VRPEEAADIGLCEALRLSLRRLAMDRLLAFEGSPLLGPAWPVLDVVSGERISFALPIFSTL
jgi:hypothetical protein